MKKETALQKVEQIVPGFEHFDREDQALPRLKIVQPTSREGTAGTFRDSLTGEEHKELNVVVVALSKGRVLFGQELGDDVVCRSSDADVPDARIVEPQSQTCATCKQAQWGLGAPKCKLVYQLICCDVETRACSLLSLHGAQVKPTRGFLTSLHRRQSPLFSVAVTLTLKKQKSSKGTYYTVEFTDQRDVDADDFAAIHARFAGYDSEKTYSAERNADDDLPL